MNPVERPGARHRIFPELLTHLWLVCLAPGLQCDLGIWASQRLLWCCREMWNTGNAKAGWMPGSRALGEAELSWLPILLHRQQEPPSQWKRSAAPNPCSVEQLGVA